MEINALSNSPNSNSIKSDASSNSFTNTLTSPQSSQIKLLKMDSSSSSSTSSLSSNSFDNAHLNNNKQNTSPKNSQKKPFLSSFIVSAKKSNPNVLMNNSNIYSKVTPSLEIIHQHRSSLLNELKSLVPLAEGKISISSEIENQEIFQPPPAPPIPINLNQSSISSKKIPTKLTPPAVAPKNFLNNSNKNCMINNRENLMNSIKNFSMNSLRKLNQDNL
jgi:hypothetical protein